MKFNFNKNMTNLDKINFLQRAIIVNSQLYYEYNMNKWSDREYDEICKELVKMQSNININDTEYANAFYDFDGTTGFYLYSRLTDEQKKRIDIVVSIIRCIK